MVLRSSGAGRGKVDGSLLTKGAAQIEAQL